MRVGSYQNKFKINYPSEIYHRVVVPVYIPNQFGYFKDSLRIFQLCLESLVRTVNNYTRITIYNNASCEEVKNYIDQIYKEFIQVDQVFHSKVNVGKINALIASTKGNRESLITLCDADVLFKNNWQEAVEDVFLKFPKAGMVSPVPSSKAWNYCTANNWFFGLKNNELEFTTVRDSDAMRRFDEGMGNAKKLYKEIHLNYYLTHKYQGKPMAVMGCGHFVATLKREVLDFGFNNPVFDLLQKGLEKKYIDEPNESLGYLRLSTLDNFAYHMGNTIEEWMFQEFKNVSVNLNIPKDYNSLKSNRPNKIHTCFGRSLVRILTKYFDFRNIIFRYLVCPD
jgi:hypothetical protein